VTRTKKISEEEFLEIFNNECKNFSFSNDQLWRKTNTEFGDFGHFSSSDRRQTIGVYGYKDFFDLRKDKKDYPVQRSKSLIGSTTIQGADLFGSDSKVFLVIPFDNSKIVFSFAPDLALLIKYETNFTDDMFIMKEYVKNFKIPEDELLSKLTTSKISSFKGKIKEKKLGFEFFTSSDCLLLSLDKVEWLKNKIKK
jgi:hypothetical protein